MLDKRRVADEPVPFLTGVDPPVNDKVCIAGESFSTLISEACCPVCICLCFRCPDLVRKHFSQAEQAYGRSLAWIFLCLLRSEGRVHDFPQMGEGIMLFSGLISLMGRGGVTV